MNNNISCFLDFVRLLAALCVFAGHLSHVRFSGNLLASFRGIEHDAVIVFFVLSGYVISYVSREKDFSFGTYLISRLSRLYSVVIPAIIITVLADWIGRLFNPEFYQGVYAGSYPMIRILANLLFMQEAWGSGVRLFSNGPFWSLSYEFFYYLLFACFLYLSGFVRIGALLLVSLVAGPNILVLGPVWFLGVLLEKSSSPTVSWVKCILVICL